MAPLLLEDMCLPLPGSASRPQALTLSLYDNCLRARKWARVRVVRMLSHLDNWRILLRIAQPVWSFCSSGCPWPKPSASRSIPTSQSLFPNKFSLSGDHL